MKRYAAVKVPEGPQALGAGCWNGGAAACPVSIKVALDVCVFPAGSDRSTGAGTSLGLPRKEVIQPHLPVRLPCYDFTPLTLHTFDASAPFGFGRRLRVQTTRVV